jgi:CubicO group peptidase (beta-lactamase class C family)
MMDQTNGNDLPPHSTASMNPERIADAFRLVDEAVARGDTPGAVAAVGRGGAIQAMHTCGSAHLAAPGGEAVLPVRSDTIFDCASLTKVVALLPLVLLLVERGRLRLGDPVKQYIPAFAAEGKDAVTVKQLLTHTSGLIAHTNLYSHGWSPEEIKAHIFAMPLTYEPGTKVVYSDLGYITLGEIVQTLLEERLDTAARRYVFEPLGMNDTFYVPAADRLPRIAATEYSQELGRHKWGEVHDENAGALGGISGHAGLFSTAADLAKYAAMWLAKGRIGEKGRLLSRASVEAATRTQTGNVPANRGLGWVLKGDSMDASGDLMSPATFGHTGFTGTSLTIDPAEDTFAILLTNRVYYGRERSVVRLRHLFHNAVAAACSE